MPLSEYEQRVLDQMERALANDDPRLASTLQGRKRPPRPLGRYVLAGVGVILGLAVAVVGVMLEGILIGVLGFLVMFAVVAWALADKPTSPRASRTPSPTARAGARAQSAPRQQAQRQQTGSTRFMDRMESRWDRRREGR